MEKIFTNKSIWKKIVVAILIVMAFQILFSVPVVRADGEEDAAQEGDNLLWAGILMRPILSLFLTVADGTVNLMNNVIMGQQQTLIPVNNEMDWLKIIAGVLVGIVVAAAVIVASIATLGAIDVLLAGLGTAVSVGTIGMGTVVAAVATGAVAGTAMYAGMMPDTLQLPLYSYSAEEIFENNILLFNVDFFNPTSENDLWVCYDDGNTVKVKTNATGGAESVKVTEGAKGIKKKLSECKDDIESGKIQVQYYFFYKDGVKDEAHEVKTSSQDSARQLQGVISQWYVGIRNICIVIMLSVLIYIGIRMMLTSVANDKAKYKEMLKDWIVGICLIFIMHYIMAFSVTIVAKITDIVKSGVDNNQTVMKIGDVYNGKLAETAEKMGLGEFLIDEEGEANGKKYDKVLVYPTNLMGKIRLEMQLKDDMQTGRYIGLVMCFIILVIFTVIFTFIYLKRLLHMAFLTIIAPLVATTYCIDKVNDGQAQGFNIWLKEYIFNLLIQPVHLLLYYILVSAAFELSSTNIIYSLVAIGFMIPAEKLLRSLFGFEKAKTPPILGGAVGTSLMMQGINRMSGLAKGGRANNENVRKAKTNQEKEDNEKFIGNDIDLPNALAGGDDSETTQDEDSTRTRFNDESNTEDSSVGEESQWASPEIAAGMENLDIRQQELDELFAGEDESTLSDDDMIYRNNLQNSIDSRREALMAENDRLNLANTSAEPESDTDTDTEQEPDTDNQTEGVPMSNGARFRKAYGAFARSKARSMLGIGSTPKQTLKNNAKRLGMATYKGASGIAKRAPGVAAGIMAGGAVAVLGGAAAIATGDEKNVLTAAGAAAGSGYSVGKRVSGTMTTSNLDEGTKQALEAAKETYNDDEYKQQQVDKKAEDIRVNETNRIKAERELGSKEAADRFMGEGGNLTQMIKSGVTDFDHMLAIEQGINNGDFRDLNEGLGTYAMLERFGGKGPKQMGAKDEQNLDKTIMNMISPRLGRDTRNAIDRRDKIKTNMDNLYTRINK